MHANIVVAGGGFAGISALRHLSSRMNLLPAGFKLVLIDSKTGSEFLPMLPDVVSGWCRPESISVDLENFCKRRDAEFIQDEIIDINLPKKKVKTSGRTLTYDYLIISTGSKTNFYGNESAAGNCYRLDTVKDAVRIRDDLLKRRGGRTNILVVGAGYTGIEIACSVHYLLKNRGGGHKIKLIETAGEILPSMPQWIKKAAARELEAMGIELAVKESVSSCEGGEAVLASGERVPDAFCIWSAGVRTSDFIEKTPFDKESTRIRTNRNMKPKGAYPDNVFVAGNAACFIDRKTNKPLRMAVMFSIAQGTIAARNVVKSIRDEPLLKYSPLDLGFLIPFADGKAFGNALGINVGGRPGYFLHYLMCLYRSEPGKRQLLSRDLMLKYKPNHRREL